MSRRRDLWRLLLLGLFGLACPSPEAFGQTPDEPERPNIIFILTDDQRADALGFAGNPIIATPEMDRLAAEGVFFANAFVTTPICAASRATILTGLYESDHGYTFQQPPLAPELIDRSYPARLRQAGYYSGFLGKLGVNLAERRDTALFDVYYPEATGFYWRLINDGTEHLHLTDLMGQRAVQFIQDAPRDRPFCLNVHFNAPHAEDRSPEQYIWPPAADSLYRELTIPPPRQATDADFAALPPAVRQGFNRVRWYWRFDTPDKYQERTKGYYRMISGIDRVLGQIRQALEAEGLAENTVILLSSDNGYFLGERQLAGKWLMYEPSLRVPLILYDPRADAPRRVDDLVLNLDIPSTLLDLAGLPVPESYQGLSLASYAGGGAPAAGREAFRCEHLWDFPWIPASEGLRTRRWKYFRYLDTPDREELYDLAADPNETTNLAGDPRHRATLQRLRDALERQP